MQSFKDTQGRVWDLNVTVATVSRVRRLTDCNILDIAKAKFIEQLSDPVTLANVLYAVCEPQASQRGITDEQFGESLAGDVLNNASNALLDAIVDFFPDETRRTALRRVLTEARNFQSEAAEAVTKRVDSAIEKGREEMRRMLSEISTA